MTAAGTDAVGALRWGLRRYASVVLGFLLLGGLLAPAAVRWYDAPVEAEALVIAQRLDMDLVALPRYGEAVFANGAVEQAVAANFGDLGDTEDIIPDRVSLVATQDSIVFEVIGRDQDPQVAADLANIAAGAFIQALNTAGVGVGTFELQSRADVPAETEQEVGTLVAVVAGLGAGLLLGLAAVAVLLIVRRPVISPEDAEEATGVPALGTVVVPRTRRGTSAPPEDFAGLIPVCRRLLALPTPTVLLVSRRREERPRQQLAAAVTEVMMRVRDVRYVGESAAQAGENGGGRRSNSGRPPVTVVDGDEAFTLRHPPKETVNVLVAPEGIGSTALRAAVVQHLGGSAEARLLLVRRGSRSPARASSAVGGHEELPAREAQPVGDRA